MMARAPSRIGRSARTAAGQIVDAAQLLLAAKAAGAAVIAWWLAPLIPFADDQYSYYAPLGVLVAMYPTLAASARSGLQALLGLAAGVVVGVAGILLIRAGVPVLPVLALVVGVGVLLGGVRALGVGRDWIAIAGLFVLMLGGSDADGFSISYLATMGFGVLVGMAVNVLIAPPLRLRHAGERLSVLRDQIASDLDTMAGAVADGSLDGDALGDAMAALTYTAAEVADDVREGDVSRKGNPRSIRHREQQRENTARFRAIERIVFFTRDLADVLARMYEQRSPLLRAAHRDELAAVIRATGAFVAAPVGSPDAPDLLAVAETGLDEYARLVPERLGPPRDAGAELTAIECLRRILDAARPFA
jgi:hypothetical protein